MDKKLNRSMQSASARGLAAESKKGQGMLEFRLFCARSGEVTLQ